MANDQPSQTDASTTTEPGSRSQTIGAYLRFLLDNRERLKTGLVSEKSPDVQQIRASIEDHYVDDQGKPAMYQQLESALYNDAQRMVTLWGCFDHYEVEDLHTFRRLTTLEIEGLTGDRHPRKVFDRSPFGIAALIVGTITIWMSVFRTFTGDELFGSLPEELKIAQIAGIIWIVGLFVVLWYILKTHRNNRQVAFLATVARALDLYLEESV